MMDDIRIQVGLITDGEPLMEPVESPTVAGTRLRNLLIGAGFHWQRRLDVVVPGPVRMLEKPQGNIRCVASMPLETYLLSVVGSEMNGEAPLEFLKAHAVISRSWALRKILGVGSGQESGRIRGEEISVDWEESDSHAGFDVCSDDHCQRFQGFDAALKELPANVAEAVSATARQVLTDASGEVADARFSKCCGGVTEVFSSCWADMDYDYLVSRVDQWCDLSDMDAGSRDRFLSAVLKNYDRSTTDFFDWKAEVDARRLSGRIRERYGRNLGEIHALEPVARGASGRITLLDIVGSEGRLRIGKELPIRRLLSPDCLYSSRFDVEKRGGRFLLKGRGWGHGAGLCQIGAARMALEGKDYREILDFYYPGARISEIGPGALREMKISKS